MSLFEIDDYKRIIRSLMVSRLLRDEQPYRLMNDFMVREIGLSFHTDQFYLVRCEVGLDQERSVRSEALSYGELLSGIESVITKTVSDSGKFDAWPGMVNENLYILVCLRRGIDESSGDETDKTEEDLRKYLMAAQVKSEAEYDIKIQIWVSDLINGLNRLRPSFYHMSMDELLYLRHKPVVFSKDMAPYLEAPSGKTARRLQQLEQSVIRAAIDHNWNKCREVFLQIIDLESECYPLNCHFGSRSVERLTEIFSVSGVPMNSLRFPVINSDIWRRDLMGALTKEDAKTIVTDVLENCEEYFRPNKHVASARVPEIVEYIDDHLDDPNLCADIICEKFGISLSYLSRIFKKQQKIKLLEYIHGKRIEKSKPLLLQTDPVLNIQQVAEAVGYYNSLSYARAFKRIEGLNPGAYRRVRGETDNQGEV